MSCPGKPGHVPWFHGLAGTSQLSLCSSATGATFPTPVRGPGDADVTRVGVQCLGDGPMGGAPAGRVHMAASRVPPAPSARIQTAKKTTPVAWHRQHWPTRCQLPASIVASTCLGDAGATLRRVLDMSSAYTSLIELVARYHLIDKGDLNPHLHLPLFVPRLGMNSRVRRRCERVPCREEARCEFNVAPWSHAGQ